MNWKRRKRKIQTIRGCAYTLVILLLLGICVAVGGFMAYLRSKGLI